MEGTEGGLRKRVVEGRGSPTGGHLSHFLVVGFSSGVTSTHSLPTSSSQETWVLSGPASSKPGPWAKYLPV